MAKLANKIALITGSSGRIGSEIVQTFLQEGSIVFLSDLEDKDSYKLAEEFGDNASFIPLNVTEEDEWRVAMETILFRFGRIDILVNNAGILQTGNIEDTDLVSWRNIQDVNITGTFLGCKTAVKAMKKNGGGVIVNIASQAAVRPRSSTLAYSASKAAVVNLTKTVALYCAEQKYNIRCNAVLPGAIDSDMIFINKNKDQSEEDFIKDTTKRYPIGRLGSSKEVANSVLFLASDESSLMTGAQLRVDGGGTI